MIVTSNITIGSKLEKLDEMCRHHKTKLVVAETWGLCGLVVCDFGPLFSFVESTGREYLDLIIDHARADQNNSALMVSCLYVYCIVTLSNLILFF